MEVTILSTQFIKPSSPTPPHLKIFKLSLLDQLMPCPYAPIILFYPIDDQGDHSDSASCHPIPSRLELLKSSLSNTLTRFYPLAGKIKDDLSIECNDQGAYFVEARVNCSLHEFLNQPNLLLLTKFFPCDFFMKESTAGTNVTNIQVNMFECGGIAIGICISHKILDGAALSTFLKAWTSTARGCEDAIYPNFIASSLFPTDDLWLRDSSLVMYGSLFKAGKSITRRIIFGASSIAALKEEASSGLKCPTRVEVISAFLWNCAMAASKASNGFQKPSLLTHFVNLRRRMAMGMAQPMENSTGNLLWIATARSKGQNNKSDLPDLVGQLREAVSRVDGEFIKKLGDHEEGKSVMSGTLREIGDLVSKDGLDHFGFSSWCKFGFYEADFGWGKPVWVSSFGMENSVYMNLIILNDTPSGHGIEAWVTLDEQHMAILERNEELRKLAMFDPSPLSIISNLV